MNDNNFKQKIEDFVMAKYLAENYKNLSVRKLCNEMNISRNSFYYHFHSIGDVPETIKKDFSNYVINEVDVMNVTFYEKLVLVLDRIKENKLFFVCHLKDKIFFDASDKTLALDELEEYTRDKYLRSIKSSDVPQSQKPKNFISYETEMACMIIFIWLTNDCNIETKYIADKINTVLGGIL